MPVTILKICNKAPIEQYSGSPKQSKNEAARSSILCHLHERSGTHFLINTLNKNLKKRIGADLYLDMIFKLIDKGQPDSSAYRYLLTIWKQRGCVIIPKVNLTENIGFGEAATQAAHFSGQEVTACQQSFPLRHPHQITVNPVIDRWFEDGIHSKSFRVRLRWLCRKLRVSLRLLRVGNCEDPVVKL